MMTNESVTKKKEFKWYKFTKKVDNVCQKIKFDKWKAWLYLLPTLVLLLIFTFWPLVNTLRMAFTVRFDEEAPIYQRDENGEIIIDDETGKKVIIG